MAGESIFYPRLASNRRTRTWGTKLGFFLQQKFLGTGQLPAGGLYSPNTTVANTSRTDAIELRYHPK